MGASVLSVVTFKWKPHNGYRSSYSAEPVNVLFSMVQRHLHMPFRFVCVTDDSSGIRGEVEVVPLWEDLADVPNPHGPKNPSCYRRLKLFDPAIESVLGKRFVSLDLDMLIVNDITPLWDRPEDVVFYGDTNPRTHYNGSMMLMTAGARPQVWRDFDRHKSPRISRNSGCWGSDQGWISYCLGPGEKRWTRDDGVYSYRNHIRPHGDRLPANARLIVWHGNVDPWTPRAQQIDWVKEHYH